MQYRYQRPPKQLSEYVRTVLVAEDTPKSEDNKLPLYTNGMPALLCRTEKSPPNLEHIKQLFLFGQSTPADGWELKKNETVIAYFFKPFALAPLFNLNAVELKKSPIDLFTWNAHKANALKAQLVYSTKVSEKIDVLNNLLLFQLKEQERDCEIIRKATDQMLSNSAKEVLSEILKQLSINERTFQRMFKKYVGISPGQYRRICQFQLSFLQLKAGQFINLTDVAFENGFADQSHFIRSFKEFTQLKPKDYIKSGLKRKKP